MPPRRASSGFTLVELIVVVLIIGILAALGVAQYGKSLEVAKADDAFAFAMSIAAANKMFALDHNGTYLTGNLSGCSPGGASDNDCAAGSGKMCNLMYCGYLARQDLSSKSYTFCAGGSADCGGSCDDNMASCAMRKSGPGAPYQSWGYTMSKTGVVTALSSDPENKPPTQ